MLVDGYRILVKFQQERNEGSLGGPSQSELAFHSLILAEHTLSALQCAEETLEAEASGSFGR